MASAVLLCCESLRKGSESAELLEIVLSHLHGMAKTDPTLLIVIIPSHCKKELLLRVFLSQGSCAVMCAMSARWDNTHMRMRVADSIGEKLLDPS